MWSAGPNMFILSWSGDKVVQLSVLVDWKGFPWVDDNHQRFKKEGKNPVCLSQSTREDGSYVDSPNEPCTSGPTLTESYLWSMPRPSAIVVPSHKHLGALGMMRIMNSNLKYDLSLSLQRQQLFQSILILHYMYIMFISVTVVKPSHPILNYAFLSLAELQIIALSCNILLRNDSKLLKLWYNTMENPVIIITIMKIIISITIAWR